MTIRTTEKVQAKHLTPGSKVQIFSEWYFIRYIRYNGYEIQLSLQPENEPLSPLYENDVITMYFNNDLMVEIEAG